MSEVLNLDDLQPIEIPVTFRGVNYVLREASEDAACKYKNALFKIAKPSQLEGGGVEIKSLEGAAELDVKLVSWCLFYQANNKSVPESELRTWPQRVVRQLFSKIREISGFDEEEKKPSEQQEILKND